MVKWVMAMQKCYNYFNKSSHVRRVPHWGRRDKVFNGHVYFNPFLKKNYLNVQIQKCGSILQKQKISEFFFFLAKSPFLFQIWLICIKTSLVFSFCQTRPLFWILWIWLEFLKNWLKYLYSLSLFFLRYFFFSPTLLYCLRCLSWWQKGGLPSIPLPFF